MTILETILKYLRSAASYNKHELAAPRVILWPDEERLWTQCIEPLRASYPALWSLGDYCPDKATGPAAWLRYQLETQSGEDVPVIYLPGIGRFAFRSADQCPLQAKHLFALQFQGQFWTQKNGKNWTPFAFFSSADGGLGLDVAGDQDTKKAIQESLPKLMEAELDALQGRKLEAGDFRAIVTKDPARTLLRWMGDPGKIKLGLEKSGSEWNSFRAVCRDAYQFDPEKDGVITAAEKLSSGNATWALVWDRYKEAPRAYPGVKDLLDSKGQLALFEKASEYKPSSNRQEEEHLETDLLALSSASHKDAIAKIKTLAAEHAHRSTWVWATLGEAPLALAIGHLRDLAEVVQASGNPSTWEALADYYSTLGWKADRSMLRALDAARTTAATKAVTSAIRAVYPPWLEKFSTLTQALATTYPATGPQTCRTLPAEEGTVYLFADGLRMDLARALEEKLISSGLEVRFEHEWSALPTVTATAKHAWMPLAGKLGGPLEGEGFEPKEQSSGKIITHARFKQLIEELGTSFLTSDVTLFPTGCAWSEFGSIDTYGHNQGAKLAWRVEEELAGLQQRILELIHVGWTKIKVITDHGWLLLPGGLPKAELPKHLAASRWNRCAIPSAGAQHGYPMTSWFWDAAEAVVLAPGVSCFVAGMEYAHGGLTLQEALIPSLTVSTKKTGGTKSVVLKEMKWSGMRLNTILEGAAGLTVDLRSKVADASTSFAASTMIAAEDGQKTSLLVADDGYLGAAAFLVVIDESGQPIFKHSVVIGEN
ncbi:MAG: BREX-1 system phosphatase PglZ type B [Deltaproteobacteria bacterium]|nr:MAG: BREX-1 system phosphatase PglZ type B [Deltaproteobacteria bacterium]